MLRALEQSLGIVTSACRASGVPRQSHYDWLKSDPDYRRQVDAIQEQALDYVEQALFKLVNQMQPAAIIFYLKTKGKARGYVERVQTQEVKAEPFVLERSELDDEPTRPTDS
jgi:hypothetical protein